ncbi:MAG: sensor histidine kinase [Candidatus Hermodarchaeota archaeon]
MPSLSCAVFADDDCQKGRRIRLEEVRSLRRDATTGLLAGLVLALLMYGPVFPAWNSLSTGVALHSLLALLAIIAAAWVYVDIRRDLPICESIIFAALVSRATIHLGAAINISVGQPPPLVEFTVRDMALDVLEIALLGVLLLIAVLHYRRNPHSKTTTKRVVTLILLVLLLDGLIHFVIFPQLQDAQVQLVGIGGGVLAAASLLIAVWVRRREPFKARNRETSLYVIAFLLFIESTVPAVASLFFLQELWALAMVVEAVAFLALTFAVATPRLMALGMDYETSFGVPGLFSLLAFVPFMVSIFAVSLAPGFLVVDLGAYFISHVGAAFLSGIMAFLVYEYSKRKPAWVHYPLILLFLSWALVEGYIVVVWRVNEIILFGESLVPYIVGSIASVITLARSIQWAQKRPQEEAMIRPLYWVFTRLAFVAAMLPTGELLEDFILGGTPTLVGSPLGRMALLSINSVAMFAVTYLTVLLAKRARSWRTLEGLAAGLLSVWIVPNVLKGNFDDWVAGWWAAEVFLLIGLLLGPALIGTLYLQEMFRAERSRRKATLLSDVLAHDVSNLHQALSLALGLLDIEGIPQHVRDEALEDARSCLRRADQLTKNVRGMGFVESENELPLEPLDLVRSIEHAFGQLMMEKPDETVEFSVDKEEETCYVAANGLLVDLFYNLFKNSVMYSPDLKRIDVQIEMVELRSRSAWETRVVDYGRGISPELKQDLFRRFMRGAEGSGLGLSVVYALAETYGGEVTVEDRIAGDYSKGTVFVVTLPAHVEQPEQM